MAFTVLQFQDSAKPTLLVDLTHNGGFKIHFNSYGSHLTRKSFNVHNL